MSVDCLVANISNDKNNSSDFKCGMRPIDQASMARQFQANAKRARTRPTDCNEIEQNYLDFQQLALSWQRGEIHEYEILSASRLVVMRCGEWEHDPFSDNFGELPPIAELEDWNSAGGMLEHLLTSIRARRAVRLACAIMSVCEHLKKFPLLQSDKARLVDQKIGKSNSVERIFELI